jgi:hypothetical protein
LKNDVIIGDIFGHFLKFKWWHKLYWKAKGRLKMPMKKTKDFVCFEMLKES